MIYTGFGSKVGHVVMFSLAWIIQDIIVGSIMVKYELKAGFFAVENYDLVDRIFSKPWTKVGATALGVWLAHTYHEILEYRQLKTPNARM